jgi:hypothetical protein
MILREVQDLRTDKRLHRERLLMAIDAACPARPSAAASVSAYGASFMKCFFEHSMMLLNVRKSITLSAELKRAVPEVGSV